MIQYMQQPVHIIDGLFLGGANTARYREVLESRCVSHVLKLFHTSELYQTSGYQPSVESAFTHLPPLHEEVEQLLSRVIVRDYPLDLTAPISPQTFEAIVRYLDTHVMEGKRVLVMGRDGLCRAPVIFLAYMMQVRRFPLPHAFKHLAQRKSSFILSLNTEVWQSLLDHYGQPYTLDDIRRWIFGKE